MCERDRLDLREADEEPLVLSEPLLRCPTTEALRVAAAFPMRSSGPTDRLTFAFDCACAGAGQASRATGSEKAELSDRFAAAPIDPDFGSDSFEARSDREALGFLRRAALRRLTFEITGSRRLSG